MPLQISTVERLGDLVPGVAAFLRRESDIFSRPRIIVPTAGVKAWLSDQLAGELGASGRGDGIVAHVDMSFPGTILDLVRPARDGGPDPWSLDQLAFAVLHVITRAKRLKIVVPHDSSHQPLIEARRIATLFDHYNVRRPGMIREWEEGRPCLSPTANDDPKKGPAKLAESDCWQFVLWRAVRKQIGEPPPPARPPADIRSSEPLLVAGLQSLSLPQLEALRRLGEAGDVEAILVHPSPGLRAKWTKTAPPASASSQRQPLTRSLDPQLLDGVDPLLPVWLSGSRDLQDLLAADGFAIAPANTAPRAPADTLLGRMQQTILHGGEATLRQHDPAKDRSVVIHRCHSLSRQAEVLHDALLHAFDEIEGLRPHDIAIVSPCLEEAAPHLEAVFARSVAGRDRHGHDADIQLPLCVADRGLSAVSPAADLLVALLALPRSRCSIDEVLSVAGHEVVREAFDIDDDAIDAWSDLTERTAVRWGLDAGHRSRHGLSLAADADVHTWWLGLERMLLGAMLPDASPARELGGVVPVDGLDPADLGSIATLARILDILRTFSAATEESRSTSEWCDTVENVLLSLSGSACESLSEPLSAIDTLRKAATAAEPLSVPFDDVRHILTSWLGEIPGRRLLRTGMITATSMLPLRGVPYKLIAVIGYDDGAVGAAEPDGDDLLSRQSLVGDIDPRTDGRRALLDCLLAAGDRLLITCNGRSVRSNQPVPLVTPLAEFVDFAVRHGVDRERPDRPSAIEIDHPRHHLSERNFTPSGVQRGVTWSHDRIAAEVAGVLRRATPTPLPDQTTASRPASTSQSPPAETEKPRIDIALLELLLRDPLRLYLQKTLGIDTWRENPSTTPATLPLALDNRDIEALGQDLLGVLAADPKRAEEWCEAQRRAGKLPLGPFGLDVMEEIHLLARGVAECAQQEEVPLVGTNSHEITLDLGDVVVVGKLEGVHEPSKQMVIATTRSAERGSRHRPLHAAAIKLMAACAAGIDVEQVSVVAKHPDWEPGKTTAAGRPVPVAKLLPVRLGSEVDPAMRLKELCDLVRIALAAPCGLFGLFETKPAERRQAFDKYVNGTNWQTNTAIYPTTLEAMVYGPTPAFDDIFQAGSREGLFLDRYCRALMLTGRATAEGFKLV